MGEAYITRRGGGAGGLSNNAAVLRITAPAGSAITIQKEVEGVYVDFAVLPYTKGHVRADDQTLADWYYSIGSVHYLPSGCNFKVIAEQGTDSDDQTVNITGNYEYCVELTYNLYIIKNGILNSAYTLLTNGGMTVTYAADHIKLTGATSGTAYFTAIGAIAPNTYKYLVLQVADANITGTTHRFGMTTGTTGTATWKADENTGTYAELGPTTWACDLTEMQFDTNLYVGLNFFNSANYLKITGIYFSNTDPTA